MELIFGRKNAQELRERFLVLDLETVEMDGKQLEVFCLIPGDKVPINELPMIENYIKLHNDFLHGYRTQQYEYCRQCIDHLRGKFGGEVDSFYEEILNRISAAQSVSSD